MVYFPAARRTAGFAYRAVRAPFGVRALARMAGDGLPAQLLEPLRFLFTGREPAPAAAAARVIERIRAEFASRPDVYERQSAPSQFGTARWPERSENSESTAPITARRLTESASIPRRWGMFLHLCADAIAARLILEMGSCIGISGAYLASASSRPRLVTLEGSMSLASIAERTLSAVSTGSEVIQGPFEQTLAPALERLALQNAVIDLAFIDGHHDSGAVMHYLAAITPHLSSKSLVVLDDIYLYRDMWQAWCAIPSKFPVAVTINVGRFGLLIFGDGPTRQFDLSSYTGWWRIGGIRQ
ncbi:MAG TPA: class I SAM-dependent methyltransferase [Thermoanaerobaculia bacterium]|nr:class I SAM-dependent methyltransferase [Thermoanaerobaculia bacterium]